ncbi:MAG TPA: DUF3536 domain-containing protein [Chloroflexota bacterium]|nr:DUF3536 domain-containing protein [Chloroflexota bacterium]
MDRFVCIHGHFYQPPRENAWLEAVEYQESAAPYHDWNERITAECYGPNAAARILNDEDQIIDIVNNYASMSFNFGPTLMSWMERHAPDVYRAVIAADHESEHRYGGHGCAIAQAYNHMIMPLANAKDRHTQVLWGLRDFQHRFGRAPEGMWLPETAVDDPSLEALAEAGIRFTILSPDQARGVRRIGTDAWQDVEGGRIDPTMPYRRRLPSGKSIDLFFYDGAIAHGVAFEGLLADGARFAERLMAGYRENGASAGLVHFATDGESYGHHHRWGEMALAFALRRIARDSLARITVYGEYLALRPPTHEVDIRENTAWSCAHGLERWRGDCGCNSGRSWNQRWRAPLRAALDDLRDAVARPWEERAGRHLNDPWSARDDYISVILDRSRASVEAFFARHARHVLSPDDRREVLSLMEMQRHAMLMYTSCGWFFDDISGIETVQILEYAGRVIQLARDVLHRDLEPRFCQILEGAKSNVPERGNGADIYRALVKPSIVGPLEAGAHFAISSVFRSTVASATRYHFAFDVEDYEVRQRGSAKLAVGRVHVTSGLTWDSDSVTFGVLHFGDQNLSAGVRRSADLGDFASMAEEVTADFEQADLAQVIRQLDKHFGGVRYSLNSLFRDEQREILAPMLAAAVEETESAARQVFERRAPLVALVHELGIPLPRSLKTAAETVLNSALRRELERDEPDLERMRGILASVGRAGVGLDEASLRQLAGQRAVRAAEKLARDPSSPRLLDSLSAVVRAIKLFPFNVDLWRVQNVYWSLLHGDVGVSLCGDGGLSEEHSARRRRFLALGSDLGIRVPHP